MTDKLIGVFASVFSAVAWALGIILFRVIGARIPPYSLNLSKAIISVFYLAVILACVGYDPVDLRTVFLLSVSGILGITLGDTFFFIALQNLGARLTSLMGTGIPLGTAILAVFFLGESFSLFKVMGILIIIAGVVIVLTEQVSVSEGKVLHKFRGISYGILSVVCASVGVIFSKLGVRNISALEATLIRMSASVVGLFTWGIVCRQLTAGLQPLRDRRSLKPLLGIVAVGTLGGFFLFMFSLKLVDASIATAVNELTPIFVLFFSALFFKERISRRALAGTMAAIAGVVVLLLLH